MMLTISAIREMLSYDFMRNAFVAGTIAAVVSAVTGYFVVLRSQNFAAHALSHIGFAGAAGAGLIGLSATSGQLILTLVAAIGMGILGEKASKSDAAIGIVLSFALGLGILFLYFYTHYAGQAMNILFGDILSVSFHLINAMFLFGVLSLAGLSLIKRPLLFASLEPELAEARGMSLRGMSVLFFILLAIAVTEASQVVGILLVFTLIAGPAASAVSCTRTFRAGILVSVMIGVSITWAGITAAYFTNWPAAFWISALSLLIYLFVKMI